MYIGARSASLLPLDSAGAALSVDEIHLALILEHSPVILVVLDRDGVVTTCAGRTFSNLPSAAELVGSSAFEWAEGIGAPHVADNARRALAGEAFRCEVALKGFAFDSRYQPIHAEDGSVSGVIIVATEITAQRASENRYQSIVETADEGIVIADDDHVATFVNPKMAALVGLEVDEIIGRPVLELVHPEDHEKAIQLWRGHRLGGQQGELRLLRPGGGVVWVLVSIASLPDVDGTTATTLAMVTDISRRRRIEQSLRESESRYRTVIHSIKEVVVQIDDRGRWSFLTPCWTELTGYAVEESLGRPVLDDVHPEDRDRCQAFLDALVGMAGSDRTTIRLCGRGGEHHVEVKAQWLPGRDGETGVITGTLDDVTERRQLERDLAQSQKLEAVGLLAAGIAHEINTPIQFVGDNLHFLASAFDDVGRLLGAYRSALSGDERPWEERQALIAAAEVDADVDYLEQEVPDAVAQALEGAQRVASIVRAMKAFGHPDQREQQWVDLDEALRNTLIVARNELKYVADVHTDFGALPPVLCHPGDLNQVFLNLLVNAAHAIADVVGDSGHRGTITVTSRIEGADAVIGIADTGGGIPEAISDKVFDPFFTTKEVGRGTGQGLSIAQSIVRDKHRGTLTFETAPGVGTTFRIVLPVAGAGGAGR